MKKVFEEPEMKVTKFEYETLMTEPDDMLSTIPDEGTGGDDGDFE